MIDDWNGDLSRPLDAEANSASETVGGNVCPFLGWYVDAETHHAYASTANHCHTQQPALTIELDYQDTCLGGDWASCPRYKGALDEGVVQKAAAIPWLARQKDRQFPVWAIVGIAVAAVALLAAILLMLRPVPSTSGSYTPLAVSTSQKETPTSALALVSTNSPQETPQTIGSQEPLPATEPVPTDTATSTPSPTPTNTPTVEPSATPSPVRPTATTSNSDSSATDSLSQTAAATSTTEPTATPTVPPTPTASPTATQTPRPTARPTQPPPATATQRPPPSGVEYSAPTLVAPADGQVFSGPDIITLRWQPVGGLAPDEYYVPTVAYLRFGETWYDETPWTKETGWTVSDHSYLLGLSDNGEFRWAVRVMRRTGISDKGKPEGSPLSPMSEVHTFIWKPPSSGGGAATSEPPPP